MDNPADPLNLKCICMIDQEKREDKKKIRQKKCMKEKNILTSSFYQNISLHHIQQKFGLSLYLRKIS